MGDSISKTLGPPTPLLPDPNPLLLAEESGGVQPKQKVTVFFGKNGGTSWLGGKKRSRIAPTQYEMEAQFEIVH